MIDRLVKVVLCHLVGDYVLQNDFIAQTKGKNWYHLFVHCALYTLPFCIVLGIDYRALIVFLMHLIVDPLKARYNKITYTQDQMIHYITALIYIFTK